MDVWVILGSIAIIGKCIEVQYFEAYPSLAGVGRGGPAVHLIAQMSGKLVEIQVRTSLPHLWAEFSEKLSDVVDPAIKYGGGRADIRDMLTSISHVIAEIEQTERGLVQAESMIARLRGQDMQEDYTRQQRDLRQRLIAQKQPLVELLNRTISAVERVKRPKP